MNIQTILVKRRLVKTIFLLTAFFVAAMFIGSAASAGIARTSTTTIEEIQPSETTNTGQLTYTTSQEQMKAAHDVALTQIISPTNGLAGTLTPEVTVANVGENAESVNVSMQIGKTVYTLYLEEYFEGTFPPVGWTNQIIQNYGWVRNDETSDARPNYAGGQGYCADADADTLGSGGPWPMECALISPSMDLSTVTGAILSYTGAFNSLGGDYADVDISVDGGATWTNLLHWAEDHSAYGPGEEVQLDISSYCGYANVQVRFLYFADSWDWYYEVDNVQIYTVGSVEEYNEYVIVDINVGETMNVVLPNWTPTDINTQENFDMEYIVGAQATITDDENPSDNTLSSIFTLHFGYFHDVALTEIVSPVDGQAGTQTPEVILANVGQNNESVNVSMNIEKAQYTLYLEEYFEGDFPPAGWTNQIIQNYGWVRNDQTAESRPNYAGGQGYCADADADDIGSGGTWPMECALISPSMDLSAVTGAMFTYTGAFNSLSGDYADVDISVDGGATWTNLQHWVEDHSAYGPGEEVQFDISSYCGYANVQVRFHYFADSWDWYYEVDNVKVYTIEYLPEYNAYMTIDINAGETTNVVFAEDWTPSDITFGFNTDYRVTASATLAGFNTIGTEGFEYYTAGHYAFPSGWTIQQTNPASTWFVYGTGTTHTSYCQETGSQNLAQNELLITPIFNFVGMDNVKLQYSAYFYRSATNGDSYVEVLGSLDGGATWPTLIKTYTDTGGVSYNEDIDISAWAANQPSVTIGYRFTSDADVNLTDYFYFDNFWIGNAISLMTEGFNTYTPGYYTFPSGWTIQQSNPTSTWFIYTTGTTAKCQETGSQNLSQNELLTSPVFNLGGMTVVKLQYSAYFYRAATNGDSYVQVLGSLDGGVTWPQLIKNYTATGGVTYSEDIDISAWAANQPSVIIGYRFVSTADVNLTDYFYFDNFWIGNEVPVITEYFNNYVAGYYALPTGWTTNVTNPTGKWWMYQSGTTVYPKVNESGSNQQAQDEWLISRTIDCSALTSVSVIFTKYFYRATTGGDSTASVLGSIDGGATWTQSIVSYTASNTTTTYPFIKDISSWAAGQANLKIAFRFISTADTSLGDYFYIDDFFVGTMWGPYGNNPPTGWTILDYGSQSPKVWDNNDWHRYSSSSYVAQGQFARIYYSPVENSNDWLISPSIDCTALTTVTLEFWHYFNWYHTGSRGYINGSIDGGTTFPYVIAAYTTVDDGPAIRTFDISSWAAGQSNVKIGFQYMDNNGMYWYVDDFKIKSDTTTIYSENFEGIGYSENFATNYIPATWGPLGWYVTPTGDTHWSATNTANAGGTAPEARFYYSPSTTGNISLCSGPLDTSAYTTLTLSFKHYVDWSTNPFTLKVETSTDGTTWGTVWSISPTGDIPASTVVIPLTGTEGIGSPTFQVRFTFSGYTYNINYWYIDNVKLGTLVTIYTTIFSENWIPSSWGPGGFTDVIQQGTHGWLRNDLYNRPNYAGGDGYCADADADAVGSGGPFPMDASLLTPVLDLSSISSAMLSYTAAYNALSGDYADVDISINGGANWTNLLHWTVDHSAYGPGEVVQLDISPYCGNANVQIRFRYYADSWDYYFEVDNVKIATVSTVYNTTFNENWIPTSWGPAGWQQVVVSGTDVDNEWDVVTTGSHPSGVVPHGETHMAQYDSYYISSGNSARLYLPNPIDFSSIGSSTIQATMWMYHDPGYSSDDDRVEVQVSLDGTNWNTVGSVSRYASVAHWEEHTFDFSAYATETTVYIGFLGISEYGNSIYIDDLSLEYYGETPDENQSDNEIVKWITLTFVDDVGVTAITQPTGPEGNWPPGTYDVAGVVGNFGSFTEYNILVNAQIWKLGAKADELFYEENITVPELAFGGSEAVTFPTVTFENADEGNFRLEMRTMLAGDDHPENDKLTKTFVIQAPDTTPPVTTAELTGTMGQNNWYISTVIITLTATDPEGKIAMLQTGDGKWPMGVNHTYYKIDSGVWTEYLTPFNVSSDGSHTVSFYSDDKAIPPNVEEEKNVSFKMDKTAPNWINYSFTPQNVLKNKWLCAAEVEDATSGVVLVEFFVDDAYVGNDTTAPYEFEYSGKPTNNSQALATDAAGNTALSPIATSLVFSAQQQYTQQFNNQQSTPSTPKLG